MSWFDNRFVNRVMHKTLWAIVLPLCALWGLAQALQNPARNVNRPANLITTQAGAELPVLWDGQPMRPLALGEVERRFARRFPGTIARLTDGQRVMVVRTVQQPTRMLHPAADCYKGIGYQIHDEQLVTVGQHRLQRCFVAERAGQHLRVCEHITDAAGQNFTDTSAWYWASITGTSIGPWQAITTAESL